MFTRRHFLSGLGAVGGLSLLPFGYGWALAGPVPTHQKLIVILMRGAVDGLSIVTPYTDANYYRLRSSISLKPPGESSGLIRLDGTFGLHPSLSSLTPLWQKGQLAFIHASGSPSETRSHFEAQDNIETGLLHAGATSQGWMNTLAAHIPPTNSALQSISYGNALPKIFQGSSNITAIPTGKNNGARASFATATPSRQNFQNLYAHNPDLAKLYADAIQANDEMAALNQPDSPSTPPMNSSNFSNRSAYYQKEMLASARNAPQPDQFLQQASQAGKMIRSDNNIQLIFMDVGGWDTHIGQGNEQGQLANRLKNLGEAVAALCAALGPAFEQTAILILSEFGRTVAENGNKGTDHGHGNVAWLLGGSVKGGKVWGRWQGLAEASLYQNRDLPVTTDFRAIIGRVLAAQFYLDTSQIGQIIPHYTPDSSLKNLLH